MDRDPVREWVAWALLWTEHLRILSPVEMALAYRRLLLEGDRQPEPQQQANNRTTRHAA